MKTLKKILRTAWEEFFKRRGVSFYLTLVSLAFLIATLVTYATTGISTFTPVLSVKVITLLSVCMALALLFAAFEFKAGKYLLFLFCLWAWLEYFVSEAAYISNVLVSIDGNTFGIGFMLIVAFGALAWVSALVAAIVQKKEIGSGRAKKSDSMNAEGLNHAE